MPYESVDALQRALTRDVFHYAKDAKKAAGRALGTLVEIITFYLIKGWGYEKHTAIERRLPEYANPDITHNVEFSLHPSEEIKVVKVDKTNLPLTPKKILKLLDDPDWTADDSKSTQLLSSDEILRNACILHEDDSRIIVAYLGKATSTAYRLTVNRLTPHPFAVLECKRVGVEEGVKKGPQTIEKAKQGAYVARTVSSLQKIRMSDGSVYGILHLDSGELRYEPYGDFLRSVVASDDASLLRDFTLTVGVVSNHGNWFTSDDHNKELKVLAQSYDWLLFLTDAGLSDFVESLLVKPAKQYRPIRDAFVKSYTGKRGENRFTKVKIALAADLALQEYFKSNTDKVEGWFNVISPAGRSVAELKRELTLLAGKNWKEILK
ncbi:hypothetical protein JW935_16490 [candidate division KSB1 bacterium]|nr:hypothetical protein [candidate division KSB1 bacterium]